MSLLTIRSGATQMTEDIFLAFFRDFIASGGVLSVSGDDFQVVAQDTPDMTVLVKAGRVFLKGASSNAYPVINTADMNLNISPNSSGNSRIDAIVVYNDLSATANPAGDNVAKVEAVAGEPAASPSAPDASAIGAAIGASNPYEILTYVTVGNGVTSIVSGNISDQRRKFLTVADANAQLNSSCYGVDAGSNDSYAITLNPVPIAYLAGMRLYFKANTVNTGACTLNVNGLGAVAIKKSYDTDLEDGDIKANQIVEVVYDGTNFQLVSVLPESDITADSVTTFTNKKITKRIISAASYTTDTGTALNIDSCDEFVVTAQAGALKLNNPSGTPTPGQTLVVRIKDNGTARALTYDTQYRASTDLPLPTTTILGKVLYLGFEWNSTDSKWDLLALLNNI